MLPGDGYDENDLFNQTGMGNGLSKYVVCYQKVAQKDWEKLFVFDI